MLGYQRWGLIIATIEDALMTPKRYDMIRQNFSIVGNVDKTFSFHSSERLKQSLSRDHKEIIVEGDEFH